MRKLIIFVAALFALTACGVDIYGKSTRYRAGVNEPIEVIMPANALFISQQFSDDPSFEGDWHDGVDIWGERGTPVLAAAPGRVIASYHEPLYGRRVRIDHGPDEQGRQIVTRYFHLDERLVNVGDVVERGEMIGRMASSGLLGAAVHLHFEVRREASDMDLDAHDPHLFWIDGVGRVT
jgi:murein DD-endopeptidase MepM/ murein hydrolase activator NlpD